MSRLIRFLGKPFLWIFFLLPRTAHAAVGKFLGFLWFDLLRVRRGIVMNNLKIAFPEKSEGERLALAKSAMGSLGRNISDIAIIPFMDNMWVNANVEFSGFENYESAKALNRGVIFLSLHLGSGDVAIASLSLRGVPMNVITKEFKSTWLNNLWFTARRKHGTKFISDRKSSFEILRALRSNQVVVFVLDQYMGPPLGVKTKFFGVETGTAMGLALIADRADCPVLPVYTYYNEQNKAVIRLDPAIPLERKEDRDQTILHMTQVYCDYIENIVRKFPEHWMWVHRRWKEFG